MCAYQSDRWKDQFTEEEYAKATRAEALRMRDELNQAMATLGQAQTRHPYIKN